MTRRRLGLTTTEVLVALFIMAIGAIAILTLFPLGAIQMGQALKDDRTAQAANQAEMYMRWYWKAYVVEGKADPGLYGPDSAFDKPNGPSTAAAPTYAGVAIPQKSQAAAVPGAEPSYPVVVDPMGWRTPWPAPTADQQCWLARTTLVPRRSLHHPGNAGVSLTTASTGQIIRACSLVDGLTYDTNAASDTAGTPGPAGATVERDMRYNFLWVLQRINNAKDRNTAWMTVVVFDRRSPFFTGNTEAAFQGIAFAPGDRRVSIPYAGTPPEILKGNWVMDATVGGGIRHAYFYRVAGVTDTGGQLDLDLQTAIRRADGQGGGYTGTLVVLGGASEVFEKPPLTNSDQ